MSKTENRIVFADVLRISATFFVIMFHISTDKWQTNYSNSSDWYFLNLLSSDLRWCVPVFFMLSGLTFLDPKRNVTIKKIYKKNILHILSATIFWSITYKIIAAIVRQINGIQELTFNTVKNILTNIFFEPAWMHLWFLYALIPIYMLVPILRIYTKAATKNNYYYLFALYMLCIGIIPFIERIIDRQIILFKINELYGYTMYFIGGWYLYRYKISRKWTNILYTLGIISAISMFSASAYFSYKYGSAYIPFIFDYLSITNIFIACSIFLFTKNWFYNHPTLSSNINKNRIVLTLSNCSFGIYLVHMISFNAIYPIYSKMLAYNYPLTVLISSIVIFTISFFITYCIKQVPYLRRWIV